MTMKRPSFQFYPGEWLKDPALRACSVGARGLWIDMMCLMHEGSPYGYLTLPNGREIDEKTLGKRWEIHGNCLRKLLKELEENGVIRRDKSGVIYSKRMVNDEVKREAWRSQKASQRGSECPQDVRTDVRPDSTPVVQPMSARSLSLSSSLSKRTPLTPRKKKSVHFDTFWVNYPRKEGKAPCKAKWESLGLDDHIEAILHGLSRLVQSEQWRKDNGKFIPMPLTFLNQRRWEDEGIVIPGPATVIDTRSHAQKLVESRYILHVADSNDIRFGEDYVIQMVNGDEVLVHRDGGMEINPKDYKEAYSA